MTAQLHSSGVSFNNLRTTSLWCLHDAWKAFSTSCKNDVELKSHCTRSPRGTIELVFAMIFPLSLRSLLVSASQNLGPQIRTRHLFTSLVLGYCSASHWNTTFRQHFHLLSQCLRNACSSPLPALSNMLPLGGFHAVLVSMPWGYVPS